MPQRAGRVAIAVLTSAALAVPAAASATSPQPAPRTKVVYDCTHAAYKPHKFVILLCGDGTQGLRHLHYTRWNSKRAVGRARFQYDDCTPDCAHGKLHHFPVTFVMKRPRTHHGVRLFTRLVTDHHGKHQTYALPTRAKN
jgi:hypothetical protein